MNQIVHGIATAKNAFEDVDVNIGDAGMVTAYLPEMEKFAVMFQNEKWITFSMNEEEFLKNFKFEKMEQIEKRVEVYTAIDSEREFQDRLTADPSRPDMLEEFHIGDALTAMRYNLRKAEDAWYTEAAPYEKTMTYLRKIAAMCVKQGEIHGMPDRKN